MQQTDTYKLNLIGGTDDFLPAPLNENMEKLEEALSQESKQREQAVKEITTSLNNLFNPGKIGRIVYGTYQGTGTFGAANQTSIAIGFTPVMVILYDLSDTTSNKQAVLLMKGCTLYSPFMSSVTTVNWGSTNVSWYNDQYAQYQYNVGGHTYLYCALGYSNT